MGGGQEGTSELSYCSEKLLRKDFYPFDARESHHRVLPHQLVTIPDLSAEPCVQKLLEQTRHIEHASAKDRAAWKSFH